MQSAERTLDAPELVDDYYLNLLDWGSNNVLSIALGDTVYLWDASSGSTSELVTVDEDSGPITSAAVIELYRIMCIPVISIVPRTSKYNVFFPFGCSIKACLMRQFVN